MKKILFAIIFVMGFLYPSSSQSFIYNRYGNKIFFVFDENRIVFSIDDSASEGLKEKIHRKIELFSNNYNIIEISPLHYILEKDSCCVNFLNEIIDEDSIYTYFSSLIINEDSSMQWCRNGLFVKTKLERDLSLFLSAEAMSISAEPRSIVRPHML